MDTHVYHIYNSNNIDRCYIPLKVRATQLHDNTKFIIGFDVKYVQLADKTIVPGYLVLSAQEICYVIDLIKLKNNIPDTLCDLMCNPHWIKVGIHTKKKFRDIAQYFNDELVGDYDILIHYTKFDQPSDIAIIFKKLFNSNIDQHLHDDHVYEYSYEDERVNNFINVSMYGVIAYKIGYKLINCTRKEIIDIIQSYESKILFIGETKANFPFIHMHVKLPCILHKYGIKKIHSNIENIVEAFCNYNILIKPKYNVRVVEDMYECECNFMNNVFIGSGMDSVSAKMDVINKLVDFYSINLETAYPISYSECDVLKLNDGVDYVKKLDNIVLLYNLNKPIYHFNLNTPLSRLGVWQYKGSCEILGCDTNNNSRGIGNTLDDIKNILAKKMIRKVRVRFIREGIEFEKKLFHTNDIISNINYIEKLYSIVKKYNLDNPVYSRVPKEGIWLYKIKCTMDNVCVYGKGCTIYEANNSASRRAISSLVKKHIIKKEKERKRKRKRKRKKKIT